MRLLLVGIYCSKPTPSAPTPHWFLRITDPNTRTHSDATLFEKQARELINSGIPQLPDGAETP